VGFSDKKGKLLNVGEMPGGRVQPHTRGVLKEKSLRKKRDKARPFLVVKESGGLEGGIGSFNLQKRGRRGLVNSGPLKISSMVSSWRGGG